MAEYDNNMTGVLFKNDKAGNEKRPDYKGNAEIDGVQYWVSAWLREGQKGKFMSMKYERKEQQAAKPTQSTVSQAATDADDSFDPDIPF